jgi:hypothetical protein
MVPGGEVVSTIDGPLEGFVTFRLHRSCNNRKDMHLLEKVYPRIERGIRFCHAVGWAGVQALGLGLLDADELVRVTVQRFESSTYLDPAYNLEAGLWLWEREALQRFFPKAGRILVGAAGSGREMIALHRLGYAVEGFECAHTLAAAGQGILRDAGCPAPLIWAPAGTVPELKGPFDGAIMGWSGYMYIPLRSQRVKLLQDFRGLLSRGAPLLVSFQTREQYERRMVWSARGANWIRRLRRVPPVITGDRLDNGFKHWFNHDDIAEEMEDAGLRIESYRADCYGWAVGTRADR